MKPAYPSGIQNSTAVAPDVTLHRIRQKRKMRFAFADVTDLTLGDGQPLAASAIDFSEFAPYAFYYEHDRLLLVDTPRKVLDMPFFYMAQFEHAHEAIALPLETLTTMIGGAAQARTRQPTFLFSIGRCGSTLFSRLAGAVGMLQFSEPDIFTGVVRNPRDPRVPDVLAVSLLALERYAGFPDRQLLVKLRSQSCASARHFIDVFPAARYVFLKRNIRDWATSFIAKFGWRTPELVRTLKNGYEAYDGMRAAGVDFAVFDYAQLVEDPETVVRRLGVEGELSDDVRQAVQQVMTSDSQRGAGIRVRTDADDVERQVEQFLEDWAAAADTEEIAFYGEDA